MKVINAKSIARAQAQLVNMAVVRAASDSAIIGEAVAGAVEQVGEQIDAAISGDLITASPQLAAKIDEIEGRLGDLEGI